MNLYLVERDDDLDPCDYDQFDSFIVAAPNEDAARLTHPKNEEYHNITFNPANGWMKEGKHWSDNGTWTIKIDELKVTPIGISSSKVRKVILTSFNAG